ncbi:2017_t:CDS:2, partial [Entrophospora sp. SA101]
ISFPQTIQQQQRQRNSATNINNINNFLISDNLNTASEFGTSYILTAATPTVPMIEAITYCDELDKIDCLYRPQANIAIK